MNPCEMTNPPRPLSPSDYEVIEMPPVPPAPSDPPTPKGLEKVIDLVDLKRQHNAVWITCLKHYFYLLDGDSSHTTRLTECLKTLHELREKIKVATEETDADDNLRFLTNQLDDFYNRIVSRLGKPDESVCSAPSEEASASATGADPSAITPAPCPVTGEGSPLEYSVGVTDKKEG